ncbi:MAG: flagellar hook-basal body complex protein FliE [Gammaproteobacteria bacterium]|nr:flagellar hook-basal body complex protein FliE [Gammaproteobacteria bacterium]
MNDLNMSRMMSDLHRLASQARAQVPHVSTQNAQPVTNDQPPGFGSLFQKAVNEVNNAQQNAATLKKAFEAGVEGVDLPQVMVAKEKASVAFEALLTVRKELLKAYQDVMSMQV